MERIAVVVMFLFFVSCSDSGNKRTVSNLNGSEDSEYRSLSVVSDTGNEIRTNNSESSISDFGQGRSNEDCVRGAAAPLVDKSVFPQSHFELNDDSSGIEFVDFGHGDSLILRNYGCEYYNLSFQFITSKYSGDTSNWKYWCNCAAELLSMVANGLDAPTDLSAAASTLKVYILPHRLDARTNSEKPVNLVYGMGDIPETVSLGSVQVLPNGKYEISVLCSIGPL